MIDNYIVDEDCLNYMEDIYSKKVFAEIKRNIDKALTSKEYFVLMEEYKEMVKKIGELIYKLNMSTPLEIAILYNELLFQGFFSENKYINLTDTTDNDLLVKTWGSRVFTGMGVCRHNTSLLVDIERFLGKDAEFVDFSRISKYKIIKNKLLEKSGDIVINHVVMGTVENGQKYLFDSGNFGFLFKDYDKNRFKLVFPNLQLRTKDNFYIKTDKDNLDYSSVQSYSKIDGEYIVNLNDKVDNAIYNNVDILKEFRSDNSKKIRKLAYLNNEIIKMQNKF